MDERKLKPFIKWVGGKRQLLPEIDKNLPNFEKQQISTYIEPFLGGGAVLIHMLENYNFQHHQVSDLNEQLINTYLAIKNTPQKLIKQLKTLQTEYVNHTTIENKKTYYLQKRTEYNKRITTSDPENEIPALFIFLNRTGFNGLYRVNSKGQFNVPFGQHANPTILDEENITNLNKAFQNVEFKVQGYEKTKLCDHKKTFIYLDPPYRPLSTSSAFTLYTNSAFNDTQQQELAAFIKEQYDKGAHVLMSNSDPKNSDPDDNFFDDLYEWADVQRVQATRAINSVGTGRGKINEILVKAYPKKLLPNR